MIRRSARLVAVLALACSPFAGLAAAAAAEPATDSAATAVTAHDLAWLSGCWAAVGAEAGSGEQWTSVAGGTLLGVSRTVKGERTVFHEFLIIRETADGGLEYVAAPSGQATTAFRAVHVGEREVTFENPAHDFPQRILYRRDGDRLAARIEGTTEKGERGVDFPFVRVACDGAAAAGEVAP